MVLRSQTFAPPVLRVVLLGASNLKMGLPTVVERVRRAAGGPVEILAACGHGRSYVQWSRIVFNARALPGLAGCGLWRALAGRPPLPTVALAMDAGNDLLYGPAVEEIAAGFAECLRRLSVLGADIVTLPLPMVSLEKVSTFRYHAARTILFPGRGEPWPSLLERARDLDRRLRRAAAEHSACLVEPQTAWYGIDPIHVRRRWRREAWDHILSHWRLRAPQREDQKALRPLRAPLFGAEELRLFGALRRTPQPACRLADGSTVALY
jgi:hypothetical protein